MSTEEINKDLDVLVEEELEEQTYITKIDYSEFKAVCDSVNTDLSFATEYQKMVFCWYKVNPDQNKRIELINFDDSILGEDVEFLRKHGISIENKATSIGVTREYVLIVDHKHVKDKVIKAYVENYIKDNIPKGKIPTSVTMYPIYKSLDSHREDLGLIMETLYNYVIEKLGPEELENYTVRMVDNSGRISVNCLDRQQSLFEEKMYDLAILQSQQKHAEHGKTNVIDVTSLVLGIRSNLGNTPLKILFKNVIDRILSIADEKSVLYYNKKEGTEGDELHFNNLSVFMAYKYNIPSLAIDTFNTIIKTTRLCFNRHKSILADQIDYILNLPTFMVRPSLFGPQNMLTLSREVKLKLAMVPLNEINTGEIYYQTVEFPSSEYKILDVNSNELFNMYRDNYDEFIANHDQLLDVLNRFRMRLEGNKILHLLNTFFLQDNNGEIYVATVEVFDFKVIGKGYNYGLGMVTETLIDNLDELGNWLPTDMLTDGKQLKQDLVPLVFYDHTLPMHLQSAIEQELSEDVLALRNEILLEMQESDIESLDELNNERLGILKLDKKQIIKLLNAIDELNVDDLEEAYVSVPDIIAVLELDVVQSYKLMGVDTLSYDYCLDVLDIDEVKFNKTLTLEDYLIYVYGEQYLTNLDHRDFISICLNYIDCRAFRKEVLVDELRKLNVNDKLNVFGCFDPILRHTRGLIELTEENFARR